MGGVTLRLGRLTAGWVQSKFARGQCVCDSKMCCKVSDAVATHIHRALKNSANTAKLTSETCKLNL